MSIGMVDAQYHLHVIVQKVRVYRNTQLCRAMRRHADLFASANGGPPMVKTDLEPFEEDGLGVDITRYLGAGGDPSTRIDDLPLLIIMIEKITQSVDHDLATVRRLLDAKAAVKSDENPLLNAFKRPLAFGGSEMVELLLKHKADLWGAGICEESTFLPRWVEAPDQSDKWSVVKQRLHERRDKACRSTVMCIMHPRTGVRSQFKNNIISPIYDFQVWRVCFAFAKRKVGEKS